MEHVYDFEVPAEESERLVNDMQREIARLGGSVTAVGPTGETVLVAHPERDILAAYVRRYYLEGGFSAAEAELEVLKIREA